MLQPDQFKIVLQARTYAFQLHDRGVNQMYDKKLDLPYSYHLQLAVDFGMMFLHLLPEEDRGNAIAGIYLHDAVEDARVTFNDVKKVINRIVARISCNLCCDIWGETRDERNSPGYYKRVNSMLLSVFGKLCDRMANVYHSKLHGSSMQEVYAKEMKGFLDKLEYKEELKPMFDYLRNML